MERFRATINFSDGSHELRYYWSDTLTKEDIEYMIEHDIRSEFITSFTVSLDEPESSQLITKIDNIVAGYKTRFSERLSKAFKLR